MAHESFEDHDTAQVMNANFINIKVDREERPDIDRLYMDALHIMGEQGGWPLTMFLTPDLKPFWGGTYFPPEAKYGRPSFTHILKELSRIWQTEPEKINSNTQAILDRLQAPHTGTVAHQPTRSALIETAEKISRAGDYKNGGIGQAPKFPQSPIFRFLWAAHQSYPDQVSDDLVWLTMEKISQGGIYDHLAGGIARYTVDEKWLVPHFEKMLYDNAQYISMLCTMHNHKPTQLFRMRIEQTVDWLLSDMRTKEGLFASSYDADSEGEEGKFYCWELSEVEMLLSESSRYLFIKVYDISHSGNWEHKNILNRTDHPQLLSETEERRLTQDRHILLKARNKRLPPGWDDKALLDWNALTITALIEAAISLGNKQLLDDALNTLGRVEKHLRKDNKLHHSYRSHEVRSHATADDYAHLIAAYISAYEATLEPTWIERATDHMDKMIAGYLDSDSSAFCMSPESADDLIVRDKYATDDVTPNANSTTVINLWKLSLLAARSDYYVQAERTLAWLSSHMITNPYSCPTAWLAFMALDEQAQIILTGDRDDPVFQKLHAAALKVSIPNRTIIYADTNLMLPENHPSSSITDRSKTAAYICRNQTCSLPVTDPKQLPNSGIH